MLTAHSIAQALFNLDRYDDAWGVIQACQKLDPAYPHCKLLEANILDKQGKKEEAKAAFEQAQALDREARAAAEARRTKAPVE